MYDQPENLLTHSSTTNTAGMDWSAVQSLLEAGGPVIVLLIAMSLTATVVFLLKCWQFFRVGLNSHKGLVSALQHYHEDNPTRALQVLSQLRNPIARVLETAISLKSHTYSDEALVREEVMRLAKRKLAEARSQLRVLEVIATLSPLLGLLGTVLGMIQAFQKLQGAGASVDPSILSGGIWEALLTTAAGLIVAIPTVMALNWLEQRIERFKLTMEDAMTQVFTAELPKAPVTDLKAAEKTKTRVSEAAVHAHDVALNR